MNRFKTKSGLIGGVLLAFFLLHVSDALAKELRIAVASNFLLPLKELSRKFKESTGHKVVVISGSTGKLYAQIKQGAPFDILLAADSLRPELLEKEGIGVPDLVSLTRWEG